MAEETVDRNRKAEPPKSLRESKQARLRGYMDWIETLEDQVRRGKLTSEQRVNKIARALYARDLLEQRAEGKAERDHLTGLLNQRAFTEKYNSMVDSHQPFGLLIFDIDSFKNVNDTYGHNVGDQVLVQVAVSVSNSLRQERGESENDTVARIGGEEFAVILPGIDDEGNLRKVAEKLRLTFSDNPLSVTRDNETVRIPLTISLGGGVYRQGKSNVFFNKVDGMLYQAKNNGRNRTEIV